MTGSHSGGGDAAASPDGEVPLRRDPTMLAIYVLAALVGFLIALIAVVLIAKHLRPTLRNPDTLPKAVTLEDWIDRLRAAPNESKRAEAAQKIVAMGPDAVLAAVDRTTYVPANADVLDVSPKVIQTLAAVGPPILESLRMGLASPKTNVRAGSVAILREMGPAAKGALDALIPALGDDNRWVRWYAVDTVGNLGAGGVPAVDALVKLLDHSDHYTRRRAVAALGRIGPPAKAAVPALERLKTEDKIRSVRAEAIGALHQINLAAIVEESTAQARDEVRALIGRLRTGDEFEARAAAKSLGDMGYDAREAVPALMEALGHQNKWVREAAAESLGDMGREAKAALPTLDRLRTDEEEEVRSAAEKAITKIQDR